MIEQDPHGDQETEGSTFTQDPGRRAPRKFSITALPGRREVHVELSRVRVVVISAGLLAVVLIGYAIWLALQPVPDHADGSRATSTSPPTPTMVTFGHGLTTTVQISETMPAWTAIPRGTPPSTSTPPSTPAGQPKATLGSTPSSTSAKPAIALTPARLPAPILVEPEEGATLFDRTVFRWLWEGPPLEATQAFDLRIWSAEEEQQGAPRRGAISPTQDTQAEVNLRYVPAFQDYGPGDYYWAVVVVGIGPDGSPGVIGDWGEKRKFVYGR